MSVEPRTPASSSRVDRRARRRVRLATAVTMMVEGRLVDAVAVDVSMGGVKIVSPSAVPVGARVSLVLFVGGELLDAMAMVRWCAPRGKDHHAAGLCFDEVDAEARSLLAVFCGGALS